MIREGPYSPLAPEREGKTDSCLGYEDGGTGRPNERNIQNILLNKFSLNSVFFYRKNSISSVFMLSWHLKISILLKNLIKNINTKYHTP